MVFPKRNMEIKIDKLFRSRRRTVGLEITEDSHLVVRAPRHVGQEYIESIVFKKRDWILAKQQLFRQRKNDYPAKQFVDNENFFYLGKPYPLRLVEGESISLNDYLEFPRRLLLNARDNLIHWYKTCALEKIRERAEFYATVTGLKYSSIRISNAQKRFGSCSYEGNLNFSWRIIMAPLEVIDYVVVHELIHLEEKNHAGGFWRRVGLVLPDYKMRKRFFKNNQGFFNL